MKVSSFITLLNVKDGEKGEPGSPGGAGKPGSDGKTATPITQYALIYETEVPGSSSIWSDSVPAPWYLGLEYWSRTRYSWSDGSVTYSEPLKCTDINTLMLSSVSFGVSYTPETFERNLRETGDVLLKLTASSSSYQNASVSWTINGKSHSGETAVLAYKKNTAPASVAVTVKLSFTRAGIASSFEQSFTITSIDTTEYTRCYGVSTAVPTDGWIINGDCYVKKNGSDLIPMVYENGSWIQITSANMAQYPEAMSKCGNAVVMEGSDIPKTSVALYAYFSSLFSKSANIDFISTQDIQIRDNGVIRSTGKEAIGDGKSGFIIKSDGTSEFVGAVIRNADLTETRIERLDADVLRTVNETLSGESYKGKLATTPYWNLGSAVSSAMGKSTQNAVTNKAGSLKVTHAEGDELNADFSATIYVTSEAERTKDRVLLSKSVDGSNAGTAYSVPSLPAKVQSSIKLGGSAYLAKITATGASCYGTKQYSFDGTNWTDYDSIEFSYEAVKGKTIRLRQVLKGALYDASGCSVSQASSCSADTMYPRSAVGNGRMVISNTASIISFPLDNPSSVSVYTPENYYNSIYALAFGNGIFLASGLGSVQGRLLSGGSSGTSWSVLSSEKYDNIFFADGYFHAHKSGTGSDGWVKSTNGQSWSADNFRSYDPYGMNNSHSNSSFCYGNGVYLQVCYVKLASTVIYKSTDGVNWSSISPGATNLGVVSFHNNLFIAHEMESAVYFVSGDNGVTWAKRTHSNKPRHMNTLKGINSAFYGADSDGKIYKIPIVNGTPTASTAGTITAHYSYKGYGTGLNLLDANGRKLLTLTTAESFYTGTFTYNSDNLVSSLTYYYKFGGIYKGSTAVASGSFDMFSSITIAWTRIYNAKDSYGKTSSVITWSGTSLTIINSDNTASRIRSNDLFSALSIAFQVISEAKGAYTKDVYPQESGKYDIGSATKKYDQIHANQINGKLVGNVQGDVTGNSSGTHTGNVNSQGTTHKVWGAVWN